MEKLTNEVFKELAAIHDAHCISIYIPTHRVNRNGDGYEKDKIALKNELKTVAQMLEAYDMSDAEIKEKLAPFNDLLHDSNFWMHQSDGLAMFQYKDEFNYFTLPESFENHSFVGGSLYLKPLVNVLNDSHECFLLSLSLNQVKLYHVDSREVNLMKVDDLIPTQLTDAVGEDYEEKHLERGAKESRPNQGGGGHGTFHGHGRSNDNIKKDEMLQFFHQINNGLEKLLNQEKIPLIVACVDYLFPIYKEGNTYTNLEESDFIKGNPEHVDVEDLANRAMQILKKENDEQQKDLINEFNESLANGKGSANLEKIVPAAASGKIEQLLVLKNAIQYGKYLKDDHKIETTEVRQIGDTDLINLAVVETIKNGGNVQLMETEEMPKPELELAAIYRF